MNIKLVIILIVSLLMPPKVVRFISETDNMAVLQQPLNQYTANATIEMNELTQIWMVGLNGFGLIAHQNRGGEAFYRLHIGELITLILADGTTKTFEVFEIRPNTPSDTLITAYSDPTRLSMMTCNGLGRMNFEARLIEEK